VGIYQPAAVLNPILWNSMVDCGLWGVVIERGEYLVSGNYIGVLLGQNLVIICFGVIIGLLSDSGTIWNSVGK
jgi:hypothetical protein